MYYHHYLSAQFMVLAHKHLLLLQCVALGNEAASYQIKGMVITTQPQSKDKIKGKTIKVLSEAS